jgi:hypothetical protein
MRKKQQTGKTFPNGLYLVLNMKSRPALDQIASTLTRNDNTTNGWIAGLAVATMDEEIGSSAHVIGGSREQLIGIWVSLVSEHVSQGISTWWEGTNILLTGTRRIITTRTRGATAAGLGVDLGTVESSSPEVMVGNIISIWPTSSNVEFG